MFKFLCELLFSARLCKCQGAWMLDLARECIVRNIFLILWESTKLSLKVVVIFFISTINNEDFLRASQRLGMHLKTMSIISTHLHPGMESSPLTSRPAIQPSLLHFFSPALFILIALFFELFLLASREFKMWVGQKYAFWIPLSI